MDLGLRGKAAVVSGSTAGIGLAIATALAAEGAKVVVNGRTEARVAAALDKIRQRVANAELRGVAADLGTANGVDAFLKQVPEADVLVNNLGIFEAKPFAEIQDADWMRLRERAKWCPANTKMPGMLKKNWGRVIFMSSESGQHIPAEMIHYGMTKTAQVAVARGLAESVPGTGVTVNSVLAGPTASEGAGNFVASMAKQQNISEAEVEKQFFETIRPTSLLKRFESTEEVASVVAFVASTQAVAINGAAVRAEGGVIRSIFYGFPQVLGPFASLGPQIVWLPVLDELLDGTLAEFFVQHLTR